MNTKQSSKTRLNWSKWDAVAVALVAGTLAISFLVEPSLPPVVATHFDFHGHADGFSARAFAALFLPIVSLAIWAFMRFAMLLAPQAWRERMVTSPLSAAACITVAFLSALHFVTLRVALRGATSIGTELAVLLGMMWLALAAILPRTRRNPIIGIRTAWTLSSDENWARTHRMASYTFLVGGLLSLAAGFTGMSSEVTFAVTVAIASALVPAVYSWAIAKHTA
ncbi:MAG: SdpI family protein [Polyangiaceae bacterium]